jgi:hypothetical protein
VVELPLNAENTRRLRAVLGDGHTAYWGNNYVYETWVI